MIVVGIDPSLTATGIAAWVMGETAPMRWNRVGSRPDGGSGLNRARELTRCVRHSIGLPGLVVVEGMSWHSGHGDVATTCVGWLLRDRLEACGHVWVEVPPMTLKKFVTGKGNSKKPRMVEIVSKMWRHTSDHNIADAIALAAWGIVALQVVGRGRKVRGPFTCLQVEAVVRYLEDREAIKRRLRYAIDRARGEPINASFGFALPPGPIDAAGQAL